MNWVKRGNCSNVDEVVYVKSGGEELINVPPTTAYVVQNADVAASWLLFYGANNTHINIVGDFDCDGICASRGLKKALVSAGVSPDLISVFIPQRSDGYGMSTLIVDQITDGVIVTVDNGIAANEAIAYAKERGFVVIVIDHHQPRMENGQIILPNADLIVDPHVPNALIANGPVVQCTYSEYCAAGLVFKVASYMGLGNADLAEVSALAAIATVADVVNLVGDNRNIYRFGIDAIYKHKINPGLQVVIDSFKSNNIITEGDIGFKIGPLMNAPERVQNSGAMISFNLLDCYSYGKARELFEKAKELNELRKTLKEEEMKKAEAQIQDLCMYSDNPIIVHLEHEKPGLSGLVSTEITERYRSSSFCLTESENNPDVLVGSARAQKDENDMPVDNIKEALDKAQATHPGLMLKYGGHAGAAGVSLEKKNLDAFRSVLSQIFKPTLPAPNALKYDLEIRSGDLPETLKRVMVYAPYGQGNPNPVFKITGFKLVPINNQFYVGLGSNTVKLFGAGCEAVGFGLLDRYIKDNYPKELDVVGKISFNYFGGVAKPQIEIIDYKPVLREIPQTELAKDVSSILKANGLG